MFSEDENTIAEERARRARRARRATTVVVGDEDEVRNKETVAC